MLDYDRFSRNDIVGSVKVPLNILRLDSPTSTEEVWGDIERERKPPEQIQEVLLSLSYLPSAERLTVQILKARNLFPPQVTRSNLPNFLVTLFTYFSNRSTFRSLIFPINFRYLTLVRATIKKLIIFVSFRFVSFDSVFNQCLKLTFPCCRSYASCMKVIDNLSIFIFHVTRLIVLRRTKKP